ncbi:MAG: ABC-F family ATP-binding cassette domain-containing protein [Hyphomicrobiaceae bacterium]
MLHINELTYRIDGKTIFDHATVGIPAGHKVGFVGRNGTGKTTLLKLIAGMLAPDDGAISWPRRHRLGYVAQEAPGGDETLIEWVLSTHTERATLLMEAETASDPARIADIQLRLNDIDAHAAPARAAQILAGLGFDEAAQNRPCRSFSGGWRMRVALASVLFLEPELLLLDEPTNYLDLEGTLWLESYLSSYPHTVLIVSHDRDLLNKAVHAILHLERGKLTLYSGNYDAFEEARRERQRLELKLKKKQDDERRRIEAFVNRFRAQANKAAQAQSRIKALARMQPIAAAVEDEVAEIRLPDPAKKLASPLMRLERAAVGYVENAPVLQGLDLRIDADDRIALLGQNGNGKSTFAKLIAGRLPVMAGDLFGAKKVSVGYFAQHQLDDLNPRDTPYSIIERLMPDATEAQRRARLGSHGFGVDKADTRCEHLSGGERARLLLLVTAFEGPNLLILDEPTNHLDVDSREALIRGLNAFEGAVIVISHDRHLIEATVDRLWIVEDGTVRAYDGDLESYRKRLLEARGARRIDARETSRTSGGANLVPVDRAEQRRAAAQRRAELAPLKRQVEQAERHVGALSAKLSKIDAALADGVVFSADPERAQKLSMERGRLAKELATAEDDWLAAIERYEDEATREASRHH